MLYTDLMKNLHSTRRIYSENMLEDLEELCVVPVTCEFFPSFPNYTKELNFIHVTFV